MYLSDLPTIYDLTPDYAGNLADASGLRSFETLGYIFLGVAGYYIYKKVTHGEGLSGFDPRYDSVVSDRAKGRKHAFVTRERRCMKYARRAGRLRCVRWRMVTVRR